MSIVAYADGGCSPNPGPGGWGVYIETPDGTVSLSGGEASTTNNRMELTAAIKALEYFPAGTVMEMRCDSQYVVNSASVWMKGWKARGWRTATGEVKNVDLMQRLDALAAQRRVKWTWVRGHAGNDGNERADALVHKGRHAAKFGVAEAEPLIVGAVAMAEAPLPSADAPATAPTPKVATIPIDLTLGLDVARAAKAAGLTPQAFVEDAVRLALALGRDEVRRLHASRRAA